MAIARQYAISVGISATPLDGTQYPSFRLVNTHATETLYIGDSSVTTANGFPVGPGLQFSPSDFANRSLIGRIGDRLYGVVGAGTVSVRVLIEGRVNP